jgi:hypothetical protein
MAEEEKRGGGVLQRLVLWLVIAALLGTVWFLASERNQRHFRTVAENGQLVIERGRFFPMGTAPSGEKTYAPVPLPQGERPPAEMEFDDQNALDRYLFGALAAWAKEATKKGDMHAAAAFVDRASQLPGLTASQLGDLTAMKADLAWEDARADVLHAADLLEAAARKLKLVESMNGTHAFEASLEIVGLHAVAAGLRSATPGATKPPPAPAPPPAATAPASAAKAPAPAPSSAAKAPAPAPSPAAKAPAPAPSPAPPAK